MSQSKSSPVSRILRAFGLSLLGTSLAVTSCSAGSARGDSQKIRSQRGAIGSGSKASAKKESKSGAAKGAEKATVIQFADLKKGQIVEGFRTDAVYQDEAGKAIGARFKHVRSAFTFDLLSMQTAPQAFMWVNTPPSSDMGQAHTQEHLLLGKGNKGRNVATLESMSMTTSTAMTMQWRTCYHFNTTAGADVFYEQIAQRLDALLNPDYTDEEVAREVRNFGVTKDGRDGLLKLEEKGTVYNEMVSNVKSPGIIVWRTQNARLYGKQHPLYYMSGGTPAGLRKLTAADIRSFREKYYRLSNMGMIAAVPKTMKTQDVLAQVDKILTDLQPQAVAQSLLDKSDIPDFPAPNPEPGDNVLIVSYPDKDPDKPGSIELFWPANLEVGASEEMVLGQFLNNIAGDPATPLYKKFIDTKTRYKDLGATGVWASYNDDLGFPISIGLSGVARQNINESTIVEVRELIKKELEKIAAWSDDDPELAAFNERLRDKLISTRRAWSKFVNSPPGFGNRWQGSGWMGLFQTIGRDGKFYRSVTMKPDLAFTEAELSKKGNIWRDYIKRWRLLDAVPVAIANKADPALIASDEAETKERLSAEVERLKKVYKTADEQAALAAYKADYDKQTAKLEELARGDKPAHLVKSLPLTTDDQLDYKTGTISGLPIVSSTFESMTGATAGLAMRIDNVAADDLLYLSFLPTMLNQMGVIVDGKPISYEKLLDIFRREILFASCSFSFNTMTDRAELVMRGAGNDPAEVDRAVYWMTELLMHPDWRVENLPRIRDVIDQSLTSLRSTRQGGYEESWVNGVSSGYWRQDWPLYMASRCFLTRIHSAKRLRWLLKGNPDDAAFVKAQNDFVAFMPLLRDAAKSFTTASADKATIKREDLKNLLDYLQGQKAPAIAESLQPIIASFTKLDPAAAKLVADAAKDLAQDLSDIPDDSLVMDWQTLCAEMTHDIQVPPADTLSRLEAVRKKVVSTAAARLFVIGSASTQASMQKPLEKMLATITQSEASGSGKFTPAEVDKAPLVVSRLKERLGASAEQKGLGAKKPLYVGFVNANTAQGVFLLSAPALKLTDTDKESLLRYLAFNQYAGGGAHSIFMKTWAAGLAYGNGLRTGPNERMAYYADKTPALPDTIKFVTQQLKDAPKDLDLSEYAIARAFTSIAAQKYESRGESIAESLVDNEPPDMVRKFRQAILDLRGMPNLASALHERMLPEYGRLLPGLGVPQDKVEDSVYMVLGDEKQMKLYEEYLKSTVGPETRLYRLYGRDYWLFNG